MSDETETVDLPGYLAANEAMMARAGKPVEGADFTTIYGYVLSRGHMYESAPLTDDEIEWLFELIDGHHSRFPIKQCFSNAQRLLLHYDTMRMLREDSQPELGYVEGYAFGFFPLHHGWLTLNGKVVDLTLRLQKEELFNRTSFYARRRLRDRVLGEFNAPRQYYGVELTMQQIRDRQTRTGCWGTLLDEWESGWPLLRNIGTQGADEGPHEYGETNEGQEHSAGSPASDGGQARSDDGASGLSEDEGQREGSGEDTRDSEEDAVQLEASGEGAG